MEHAFLTDCTIDVPAILALVETPEAGAIATFLGTSRASSHDRSHREREVHTLWYEAYGPMALRRLREIAAEAHTRFDVRNVAVVHRTGEVPVGQASVAIAVAAAHRGPAFDACRWVIDEIKRSVPIWKRERFADGEEWVEGYGGPAADTTGAAAPEAAGGVRARAGATRAKPATGGRVTVPARDGLAGESPHGSQTRRNRNAPDRSAGRSPGDAPGTATAGEDRGEGATTT